MPVKAGTVQALNWVYDSTDMVYIRQTQGEASTSVASSIVSLSSVSGPVVARSSAADALVTLYQSTFGALAIDVHNSTIGDMLMSVAQNSTVWEMQVSGVSGRVRTQNSTIGDFLATVRQNSTNWVVQAGEITARVRAQNSTITDLLASVQQNSTVWAVQSPGGVTDNVRAQNSTIGDMRMQVAPDSSNATAFYGIRHSDGSTFIDDSTVRCLRTALVSRGSTALLLEGSTNSASSRTSTAMGLVVRSGGQPDSTSRSGAIGSTVNGAVLASAATAQYVYGLSLTVSSLSTATQVRFFQGSTTPFGPTLWMINCPAGVASQTVSYVVDPPGYLFRTDPGERLSFQSSASIRVEYNVLFFRA